MDFMYAWFPIAKFVFGVAAIGLIWWLFKKKLNKLAYTFVIFVGIVLWFAPVKYDGTQTKTHSKMQQNQRTQEYKYVADEVPVIHQKKKTFDEVMAEENARSEKENKKVINEIVK